MSDAPALDRLARVTEQLNQEFTPGEILALVEKAPDGIVVANTEGRIALVNEAAELMSGYHRAELLGQPVEMLIPERVRGAHVGHRQRYMDEPRARTMGANLALAILRKEGGELPVDISLAPMVTTRGTFVITFIRRRREPAPRG